MSIVNRGPELVAVGSTLVAAAILATLLRCYTRIILIKGFGFDDWCMVCALISFILFVTCALVGVHYGTGRHNDDLSDHGRKEAMKFWWYCYIWYCLTMIASKLSIGTFLLRITVRRLDIWIIYGVMAMTIVTGVVFFFVTMFQCTPISYFWNKDQDGSCLPMEVIIGLTYLYSACSVICDFTFAFLPMFIIWKLNMNKRSKIALAPIMAMACVASAAVVIRFPYVKNFKDPDFLYATIDIAIWSCTEQGLAITAGSLATLRPLLRNVGYCFGLSTPGPTELPDSDIPAVPRSIDGISSGNKYRRDHYSLSRIDRDDDGTFDIEGGGQRHHGQQNSHLISPWRAQSTSQHGSEECLAKKSVRDAEHWKGEAIVKVQTVPVTSDRIREP